MTNLQEIQGTEKYVNDTMGMQAAKPNCENFHRQKISFSEKKITKKNQLFEYLEIKRDWRAISINSTIWTLLFSGVFFKPEMFLFYFYA